MLSDGRPAPRTASAVLARPGAVIPMRSRSSPGHGTPSRSQPPCSRPSIPRPSPSGAARSASARRRSSVRRARGRLPRPLVDRPAGSIRAIPNSATTACLRERLFWRLRGGEGIDDDYATTVLGTSAASSLQVEDFKQPAAAGPRSDPCPYRGHGPSTGRPVADETELAARFGVARTTGPRGAQAVRTGRSVDVRHGPAATSRSSPPSSARSRGWRASPR